MKTITVKATRAFFYEGKLVKAGTVATYERAFAAELISNQKAVAHDAKPETKTEPAEKK